MSTTVQILILASQLVAAADTVPAFDIARICRAEGTAVEAPGRCADDEGNARSKIDAQWHDFDAASKATCTRETNIDGTPSYVELLTCLEMARDAKKLKQASPK